MAMTSVRNVFVSGDNRKATDMMRRRFAAEEGDHITLLNGELCFDLI